MTFLFTLFENIVRHFIQPYLDYLRVLQHQSLNYSSSDAFYRSFIPFLTVTAIILLIGFLFIHIRWIINLLGAHWVLNDPSKLWNVVRGIDIDDATQVHAFAERYKGHDSFKKDLELSLARLSSMRYFLIGRKIATIKQLFQELLLGEPNLYLRIAYTFRYITFLIVPYLKRTLLRIEAEETFIKKVLNAIHS